MRDTRYENGFTLVELLVALMVTSIILTAVATLAFALGTANQSSDDTSCKQAQVRFATLRILELIRHCKLICGTPGSDLALWRADDNGDGQININELVYIEAGPNKNYLRLCEFSSSSNPSIKISYIEALITKWWLKYSCDEKYALLIPQCSNVQFQFDEPSLPPTRRKFVSVSFGLVENGIARQYQISAALRGWAGNLLSDSGEIVSGDDD